mgnify:FL=1
MNKAEAKAVVTIPMKGRYFLHKNGSIIPVTDLINAIYLMTGDEKINEWDPDLEFYIRTFFGNIVREMSPNRNYCTEFLKHHEKSESNQIVLSHAQHRVAEMYIGRSQRLCGTVENKNERER